MAKYDVTVVGAGIGGLAVAALLSKRKKRALLLDQAGTPGGALAVFEKKGFHFTTAPMLTFGFERDGALSDVYANLGVSPGASVLSPCYQVVLPDRRVNIYAEASKTLEELRREFPREIDNIARFYRDLKKVADRNAKSDVSTVLSRQRSADGFLRRYRFSSALNAFFDFQSRFFLHLPVREISLIALASLFANAPFSLHGGFKGFADQLYDAILRNGGEVRLGEQWPALFLANGRVTGLKTKDGMVDAQAFVFNTEQQQRGSSLFIGLREDVVPVGMSLEVLYLPEYARPDDFLGISLSAPDDEAMAPKGMRALTASFPTAPYKGMKDDLLKKVRPLIPFLDQHLVFAEEYIPVSRKYDFPPRLSFKPTSAGLRSMLLEKALSKKVYLLHDGKGSPMQAVHAARRLVDRLS